MPYNGIFVAVPVERTGSVIPGYEPGIIILIHIRLTDIFIIFFIIREIRALFALIHLSVLSRQRSSLSLLLYPAALRLAKRFAFLPVNL